MNKNTTLRTLMSGLLSARLALLGSAAVAPALAQGFPNKAIKFVVPFPPGSATDTSARYFAKKLSEMTSQPVIIDNKAGGNGFIAVRAVLSAPADGYTVFIGSNSSLAVNAALFKSLPYDPIADFSPLTMMVRAPAVLIVPGSSKHTTLAELIAAAKAKPGALNYAHGSAGYQLMAELFNESANVKTYGVPFKSATDSVIAVASETVQFAFVEVTSAQELVKSGKLHALAVASASRISALQSVPTSAEAGLSGFNAYVWVAAAVSSKTPKAESDKLAAMMAKIENLPETREFYERIGGEVMRGGADEMRAFQIAEIDLWKRIAVKAKIEQQ